MCNSPAEEIVRVEEMFDHLPVGVVQVDAQGRLIRLNRQFCQMLGCSASDIAGRTWPELARPCGLDGEALDRLLSGEECTFSGDRRLVRPDGTVIWVLLTASTMPQADGCNHVLVVMHDISDRNLSQDTLREGGARLKLAMQSGSMAVWEYELSGNTLRASENLPMLFGLSACGPYPAMDKLLACMDPQDQRRLVDGGMRAIRRRTALRAEYHVHWPDGQTRWLSARGEPVVNAAGEVVALTGAISDITDRVQAERALRESEARFRSLADNARAGVFMLQQWRIVYANRYFQDMVGYSMVELITMDALDLVHPDFRPVVAQRGRDRLDGLSAPGNYECILLTRDGRHRWVDVSPGRFEFNGQPTIIAIAVDITDRKLADQKLRDLNETLEHRVAQRTAEAQHRLTQLRSMSSQLAQAENHERKRLARILHDHLQQLLFGAKLKVPILRKALPASEVGILQQLEDLLQQSITVARNLAVELSPPVLHEGGLAAALKWLAQWMQEKQQLTVHIQADAAAEPQSEQTKVMLFQAVRELLFNVVKHAKVNQAQVRMTLADHDYTRIIVRDRGNGFDSGHLHVHETDGSFGLLNVRERLEVMGGTMEIRSRREHGTTISLTAPITQKASRQATAYRSAPPGRYVSDQAPPFNERGTDRIRVLLADDHKIFREALASLLGSQADLEIAGEACDGVEAIELAQRLGPDVILMDVSMPRMNGIEATKRIVQACPQVQIIALSMHDSPDMSRSICEAGAAVYITKDGPSETLLSAIRQCAEARNAKE